MASAAHAGTVDEIWAAKVRADLTVLTRSESVDFEKTAESSATIGHGAIQLASRLIAMTIRVNRWWTRDELKNSTIPKQIQINCAAALTRCAQCEPAATSGRNPANERSVTSGATNCKIQSLQSARAALRRAPVRHSLKHLR